MCFYHILHKKIASVTYGGPHRILFAPPPKVLEKNRQYFIIFLCTFLSSICCV